MPEWQTGMIGTCFIQAAPISNCTHGRCTDALLHKTITAFARSIARSIATSQFSPAPMQPISDEAKQVTAPPKSFCSIPFNSAATSASSEMWLMNNDLVAIVDLAFLSTTGGSFASACGLFLTLHGDSSNTLAGMPVGYNGIFTSTHCLASRLGARIPRASA